MNAKAWDVHPELRDAARKAPSFTTDNKTLWLMRIATMLMPAPKKPLGVLISNRRISRQNSANEIRLRLYHPDGLRVPAPALLWAHGGGYVMGKASFDDPQCAAFAREAGIVVVSVEYRLSPDHAFPAGLEDCLAALRWMQSEAQQVGIDANRIAVGGASAGAGLAAAVAQSAHDRGERLAMQLLIYPMLDDRTARAVPGGPAHIAWNRDSNRFGWRSYLGEAYAEEKMPTYAAPARREDLSGLAPAWVGVGSIDLFHDEDVAYAQRLKESGVETELLIVPGAFHGFDLFASDAPVVRAFRTAQIAALKKYLFA